MRSVGVDYKFDEGWYLRVLEILFLIKNNFFVFSFLENV